MKKQTDNSIVFFGTSEFAVPALNLLVREGYRIILVVTPPDEPAGRSRALQPSPIKIAAQALGLTVAQPPNLNQELGIMNYELGVVCAYGKLIPKKLLDIPKYGTLNIHPSLLPKYRGASPIQAAILGGDKETGVSIMKLDAKMDHGPIVVQETIKIDPEETAVELNRRLAEVGAKLLIKIIPQYLNGENKSEKQDDAKATYTKILNREDGKINWTRSADEIYNQWRALQPWPGVYCESRIRNQELRIKFLKLRPGEKTKQEPGEFIILDKKRLAIACAKNQSIEILELQPEGKKPLTAEQFINGYLKN
ncbi:MAG: methionyl-tRNA formyltransferase [Patescibacteria group bacterium]